MFNYRFGHPEGSMNECTGIVTYQSNYIFAQDPKTKHHMQTVTPVIDLPTLTYNLLINSNETYLI
jgi:hypothetical protein